jgi:hypothetical protein
MNLENTLVNLHETKQGKLFISFHYEGKHYRAFFTEWRAESENSSWLIRDGHIRVCDWEKCRVCNPNEVII